MRKSVINLIVLMLATQFGMPAAATSIYRCVGTDRIVKFQDTPCRSDENSRRVELPDAPPIPVIDTRHTDVEKPSRQLPSDTQAEPTPVLAPDVSAVLCTREDGSRYLSDSGRGERRAVPLGMLGIPGDSLAGAYAGRDGIGVSAPGLGEPPSDRSYYGQLGAMYVWVEDPCARINGRQLCEFLDGRITDAERRLRFAFSDTSAQVRQELTSLRQRARQCPR